MRQATSHVLEVLFIKAIDFDVVWVYHIHCVDLLSNRG